MPEEGTTHSATVPTPDSSGIFFALKKADKKSALQKQVLGARLQALGQGSFFIDINGKSFFLHLAPRA